MFDIFNIIGLPSCLNQKKPRTRAAAVSVFNTPETLFSKGVKRGDVRIVVHSIRKCYENEKPRLLIFDFMRRVCV
jgi:hypothetical protein